jgi:tripartite-type tricarboxylate transporter receptor subunit TctC
LLGGNFSHAVNPHLFRRLPFDPLKDFSPVLQVTHGEAQLLCVPATLAPTNMAEFLTWARREGDKVNFGSSGPGSPGHIAGAYFNQKAGLQMTHVPYKGSSEAVRDLVGGQIQMAIVSTTTALPLVRDGRLKALMQTTAQRSRFVTDVPSAAEAGWTDFDMAGWYGIWAPAGVPTPALQRLNQAFNGSLADPSTRQRLDTANLTSAGGTSEAFARFVQSEIRRWEPIVKASGAAL